MIACFDDAAPNARRRFLQIAGLAGTLGGLAALSGCGGEDDAPVTGAAPTQTPSPTPTPSPGPAYTANDADRLNLLLQVNYLVGGFFARGVLGEALPAASTGGSGTPGNLTGGSPVTFADDVEAATMREIAYDVQSQIERLRAMLGGAVTARPATTIAGGAGGPFQAIASVDAFPATSPIDPYASPELFLVAAVALTSVRASMFTDVVRLMTDRINIGAVAGMSAIASQHDAIVRQTLWLRGRSREGLFGRIDRMSDTRERFDGGRDLDQGVGSMDGANFVITDAEGVSLRRTPEQALNILYASQSAVSAGGFFPAGVNGLIRFSGANTA